MRLSEFFEYLHTNAATAQLAEGLAEVFAFRGVALVPVEVPASQPMRAVR
jgi:hypothetical protein